MAAEISLLSSVSDGGHSFTMAWKTRRWWAWAPRFPCLPDLLGGRGEKLGRVRAWRPSPLFPDMTLETKGLL